MRCIATEKHYDTNYKRKGELYARGEVVSGQSLICGIILPA